MPVPLKKASTAESLRVVSNVLLTAFVVGALYLGRDLLVPLALAALLTFLLSPLVSRVQRWVGKICAVLLVVLLLLGATVGAGWILTRQVVDLANELPSYKENIRSKLRSFEIPSGGPFSKAAEAVEDLKQDLPSGLQDGASSDRERAAREQPLPVTVVSGKDQNLETMQVLLSPVLGPLGTAGLVLLLLVFMLLQREDLRNRLIRLIGQGRISTTTRAMDDAGSRVSKYLLMLLIVNITYGIPVAIGLYFIGVPNALLWGSLAIVLRFIPYVGPWIAASFPILLSLAVAPDWMAPLLTISLFIVLELLSNNVMEPWLYGSSTGVTPIALIIAALLWTFLWGPLGLVLATPLTVCMVVMGRHIPRLAFLSIALSDEEALTPAEECYHRLHRMGEHDETEFVENYLKTHPMQSLFDEVLIPVVAMAETDHRLGLLETEQLQFVEHGIGRLLEDLEVRPGSTKADEMEPKHAGVRVCSLPARAERDELAGCMLVQLLLRSGFEAGNASAKMVSGELVEWVRSFSPDFSCISVVPPTRSVHARYLCAKLRSQFPDLQILVCLHGPVDRDPEQLSQLQDSGADEIVSTVGEAADWIIRKTASRLASGPPT
jgi:predicted PurR-regulated permease PerM